VPSLKAEFNPALIIGLMLLASVSAGLLAVQPVKAANGVGVLDSTNIWAPYGPDPSIRNILMKFYGDDQSELNAFQTGQLDIMDSGQSGSGVPVSLYNSFQSNPDWLITPTQGAGIYHGIYYNLDDQADGSGTVWHSWGCPFQHGNSLCGIEIRQAFAHLLDRPRFVSDGPLQGGGVPMVDDVAANKIDPFTNQIVASSFSDQCSWDTLAAKYTAQYGTCIGAFNLAPDPGGFAAPGSPDFCAAVDHLIQANSLAPALGLQRDPAAALDAFGNHCGIDPASPGLPNIVAHPMRAFPRHTDPRLTMGLNFANAVNTLFAGNRVNTFLFRTEAQLGSVVFFCCFRFFPTDDWEWYTFGYQDNTPYPTTLFNQFHSQFASNVCGGSLVVQPTNPTFVCILALDTSLLTMATTLDPATLYSNAYAALNILGSHAVDLPAYTFAVRTGALRSVVNPVNSAGLGYENPWNFLIAHKSSYTPVDSRFQFDGGGPSDTIRWGQAGGDIVANLNPYFAQWVWEFNILGEVYDTLFAQNPVSPTQVFCWICNSLSTSPPDANGNEHITVELKQNLHWQDGTSLDAYDVKFSIITERDFSAVLSFDDALVLNVNVLSPLELDITMRGVSIAHPLNVGNTLIIPRHIYQLAGDNTYGQGVGVPDPATLDPSYDPVAQGTLIGSGPYQCRSRFVSDFGRLGTGCITNSDGSRGGQNIETGGSVLLTVYDNTGQAGAGPFDQWFRLNNPAWGTGSGAAGQSGQFQEFSWADRYDNASVTIQDVASVEACFGKTSSTGCADYSYWIRPAFHPGTPGTISSEVVIVLSHLDDTWVYPFSWNGDQSMQPGQKIQGIVPFTP